MKTYMAIIASIMMLATNGFGKGAITAPVGVEVEKVVAYVSPADDGIRAIGTVQDRTDHQMLSSMPTSAMPSAGVVLTAGRGGGAMQGSWSGRSHGGHSYGGHSSFHGGHSYGGHFRGHGYYPYHRGYGHYPYRYYPYRYHYPYSYNYPYYYPYSYNYPYYYPYSYNYPYYYGNPGYYYPYPYSYFYFSW